MMQTFLIEFVIRTSLIAVAAALVLTAMRIRTAPARHAVWAGVVLTMIALPAWVAWGPKARVPILPPETRATAVVIPVGSAPVLATVETPSARPAPQRPAWSWAILPGGIYFAGGFALLLRLAVGTVRAKRLRADSCFVPVTVGFFRPRIILPEGAADWPRARLDAVLLHEREHARRRDPLFQWIALLNRALFWFHPLAWWLERKLSGLAEEACDAAVLAKGLDAREYSEVLLDLARSVERAGARVEVMGMAMPGAFLPQRIRRIMGAAPVARVSPPRMMCAMAACAVAAAIFGAATLVRAQPSAGRKGAASPVFEVASVRPADPGSGGGGFKSKDGKAGGAFTGVEHNRFGWKETLYGFVLRAYGIQGCGVMIHEEARCAQLSGGPAWINEDRFEIQAKMPEGTPEYTLPQFTSARAPQLQQMLQALLADRFKLKLRREKKEVPVYALTAAKTGTKIRPAAGTGEPAIMFNAGEPVESNRVKMTVKDTSMQELASAFGNILGRPVLDRTGLKGKFDFTMEYEKDAEPPDSAIAMATLGGPGLFKALESQAGLKLESTKGAVEVLVIDHAEKPSGN
jgi:bla regulator protein blaR1